MDAKHIRFIRKKLIPFILREQGRGFKMDSWLLKHLPGNSTVIGDGIERWVPKCGTVACIGGSIQVLLRPDITWDLNCQSVGTLIGLSKKQAETLFLGWGGNYSDDPILWPRQFCDRYAKAKTTLGKAKIACALLEEVCKTKGKCLDVYDVTDDNE